ncbi:ABC transporter [Clostridium putrefaciens]|uniref:ABC transporter n=1 Tax=Clostridium putrefaciens TaxID=99675 RepID=A0A381JBE0_9CLOT|nr:ABC transporter ATP-binding protein [Clostridium putrefaciens]SUY48058.1 ABC transporter [Clostridium putrefaciens]
MVNIKDLTFAYDGNKKILDDLSFNIEEGVVYSLLGINGSGKTTLLKCLNGDLPSNIDVTSFSAQMLYIHDEMQFYNYLTGEEFLNVILNFKDVKLDQDMYNELLSELLMNEKIKQTISSYSLGMKHKLILIIAFLLKYKYILMDEPFTSLDVLAADTMIEVVKRYAKNNNTVIISTHMIDIAQEISDKILLLSNGKIQEYDNNFKNTKEIKAIILKG